MHIKKSGNLKRFSMVTCKTVSDTAKSNRDAKLFDFVHTNVKVEFNEDESLKACDVIVNRDQIAEGIESFYVVLEDAKYSVNGPLARVKVNILDKIQEVSVEFEKLKYEIQESDKFISLPIVRSGDLSADLFVDCVTQDESAVADLDFVPRVNSPTPAGFDQHQRRVNQVKIPSGEVYGFCDVEIVDDDVNEPGSETLKAVLVNPSFGVRIGQKSETTISIIGPNDGKSKFY